MDSLRHDFAYKIQSDIRTPTYSFFSHNIERHLCILQEITEDFMANIKTEIIDKIYNSNR